ncbi:helix-turn-helix transcriptional regulator [Pikeienuella piscinae]|uniref:Helix-turn-helix transcriptional regulator n=1 Tax=Pikeienuella piscinae TaxID=2748098 RepID=A0A7L5BW42_9RHOB|nr:helix-turn-helix transcriptional regulator [Pikeienuella piscinae]QIE54446.1 helix-turn-helix transcriptional regulator [Pikeienuella piscinae]
MPMTPGPQYVENQRRIAEARGSVFAVASDYPDRMRVPPHRHVRDQLLHALSGVVLVSTVAGRWIVPPEYALWIPAGCEHQVEMLSAVRMRSVYLRAGAVQLAGRAPRVLGMSALARALLFEAMEIADSAAPPRRDELLTELLLVEISRLSEQPLVLPMPADARLMRLCRRYIAGPSARAPLDEWADEAGMSRRSLSRHFRRETGLTLDQWRQQACVFAALPRLIDGEPITRLALDLGYESPAAFTTMFRRMLGRSPRAYSRHVTEGCSPGAGVVRAEKPRTHLRKTQAL